MFQRSSHSLPLPPKPPGRTLLGNFLEFRRDPFTLFTESVRSYGDVVGLSIGPMQAVIISHPDHVKHVLVDHARNYVKSVIMERLKVMLGNGLLTSEGDFWKRQRRMAQPAFHRESVRKLTQVMIETTGAQLDKWAAKARRREVIDFGAEAMELALILVGRALFGTSFDSYAAEAVPELAALMRLTNDRAFAIVPWPMWVPTPKNVRLARALRISDRLVYDVLHERTRERRDGFDLVSMLMDARDEETGEGMTHAELRDELVNLVLAGHETSGCAVGWTYYMLDKNPEIARRFQDEVQALSNSPTPEEIERLAYTPRLIHESMRIYPPGWQFNRQAIADDEIGGFLVRAGTVIFLSPWVTHRRADLWTDPLVCDPDRFLPQAAAKRSKFSYYPFGGGQRICIGNNLALLELSVMVSMIARRFYVEMLDTEHVWPLAAITMRPMSLRARLHERN